MNIKIKKTVMSALVAAVGCGALAADVGVKVNGTDVSAGGGDGWTYEQEKKLLMISGAGPFTLSGTNTTGAVCVLQKAGSTVVLSDLMLDFDHDYVDPQQPPYTVDTSNSVEKATILLKGDSRVRNGLEWEHTDLKSAAIYVSYGSTLVIDALRSTAV